MIPKRELIERLAVAENKLSKLYRYIPSLEYMIENEAVMASMGFSLSEIGEDSEKEADIREVALLTHIQEKNYRYTWYVLRFRRILLPGTTKCTSTMSHIRSS